MYVLPALVFCLLFQVPSPSVKPEKPVVKNGGGDTKGDAARNKKQSGHAPSISGSTDMPSAPQADKTEPDSGSHTNDRVYSVKVLSQPDPKDTNAFLVYVVFTALAMIVNAAILFAIIRQNKINWRHVRINVRASRAARASARASRDSADALVASERAWIMVEVIPAGNNPQIIRNQDGTIGVDARCVCENQGKTGAWINEIRCAIEFSPLRLPEVPNLDDIGPYESIPRPIASRKNPETYMIQPGCRGDWNNKILILYGVVKYRDMFGKDRQTTFGYVVSKNGEYTRIVGYPKYNENT